MQHKIFKMDDIPEKLLSSGKKVFFKKDEIIFHSGDKPAFFYILVKGKVISISNTKSGAMIYDVLVLPPCIIGESCIINNEEIPSTFKCLDNVELIKITKNVLLDIYKTDIDVALYLHGVTSNKFKSLMLQNIDYSTLSSEQRIVQVLIEFAELLGKNFEGKVKINFKITQQFISDIVGVKRITTSRTFEKLKHDNVLELIDGIYYVKDIALLKHYLT